MKDVKNYEEYQKLFSNDLVVAVRTIIKKIENNNGFDIVDSKEHNELINYFNNFRLHKKLSEKEFNALLKK